MCLTKEVQFTLIGCYNGEGQKGVRDLGFLLVVGSFSCAPILAALLSSSRSMLYASFVFRIARAASDGEGGVYLIFVNVFCRRTSNPRG